MVVVPVPEPGRPPLARRGSLGVAVPLVLLGLVAANVILAVRGGELKRQSDRSQSRLEQAERSVARRGARGARRALLRRALSVYDTLPANGAAGRTRVVTIRDLRETLTAAERGIPIRRGMLELRQGDAGKVSVRVQLSGGFDGLWSYLNALEVGRFPLAIQDVQIRPLAAGGLSLDASWRGVLEPSEALAGDEIERLVGDHLGSIERWISEEPTRPSTDPFNPAVRAAPPVRPITETSPGPKRPPPENHSSGESSPRLRLGGFVKPSAEGAPYRAAIELDGAIHLVEEGDRFGDYELESIAIRDHVVVVDRRDGTRVTLRLDR